MIRAAFPAPRRLRKADRLRIFARAGGKCQCDGAVCALAAFGGDLAAFDQAITDRARRLGDYPAAFAWARGLGFEPTEPLWHVDHVIPLWAGGTNEDSNLRLLAAPCHRRITAEQAGQRGRAPTKKLASVRRLPCVDGGFEDGRCTGCGRGFMEHRKQKKRWTRTVKHVTVEQCRCAQNVRLNRRVSDSGIAELATTPTCVRGGESSATPTTSGRGPGRESTCRCDVAPVLPRGSSPAPAGVATERRSTITRAGTPGRLQSTSWRSAGPAIGLRTRARAGSCPGVGRAPRRHRLPSGLALSCRACGTPVERLWSGKVPPHGAA